MQHAATEFLGDRAAPFQLLPKQTYRLLGLLLVELLDLNVVGDDLVPATACGCLLVERDVFQRPVGFCCHSDAARLRTYTLSCHNAAGDVYVKAQGARGNHFLHRATDRVLASPICY